MRTRVALLFLVLTVAGCGAPTATGQPAAPANPPAADANDGQPPASQPSAYLPPADPGNQPGDPANQQPAPAVGGTGINGVTVVRSGCPMARAEPGCPAKPVAAWLQLTTSDGAWLIKVQSDANGQFGLAVPPGSYLLRPMGLVGGPGHDSLPVDITVQAGQYTTVTVLVDSGLR